MTKEGKIVYSFGNSQSSSYLGSLDMFYLPVIKQCFFNFSFKNSQDYKSNFLEFQSGQCLFTFIWQDKRNEKQIFVAEFVENIHEIKPVFSLCKILLYNGDKDEIMTKKSPKV